ncbi:MAG: SURF1 family protein [Actinomycetota bacterium]
MLRFLLTPKWLIGTLLAIVVAVVCVRLGFWQLDRLDEKRTYNETLTARRAEPPLSLVDLAEHEGPPGELLYRRVQAQGTFDIPDEVILYGRSLDEQPGNHVLNPLAPARSVGQAGCILIVDRGWVPYEMDTPPVEEAGVAGEVDVTGVLFPSAPADNVIRSADGRITTLSSVDVDEIAGQLNGAEMCPGYLWLRTQSPQQASGLPRPVPLPELTDGPHLSYAIQWFVFALIAVGGWLVLIRKEFRERRPDA